MELPTRCAYPTMGGRSTYTVLGFTGYLVASILGAVLASLWGLDLVARLITFFAPPLAFLAVVYSAKRFVGYERIVFYQTSIAGVVVTAIAAAIAGEPVARCVDIATVGIGTFLVFGRIGCFSVACCHGKLGPFGVRYGQAHVKIGFWKRWAGRTLWPVQLAESFASLALVVLGLVIGWDEPGTPALIYIASYSVIRFLLELLRGDSARPHRWGLSEAQVTAPLTAIACVIWRPSILTGLPAALLVGLAIALVVRRTARELWMPAHLHAIDKCCTTLLRDPSARVETPLGLAVSQHQLPDGRRDWVMSSTHPHWSPVVARKVAASLFTQSEVVEGRLAGVIHVITREG
ncbi:MAG: prolipoprotein diacylglyceryl transferase [Kofleriaceae bacterium]